MPLGRLGGWPHRLGCEQFAAMYSRLDKCTHVATLQPEQLQQTMQRKLRMTRQGMFGEAAFRLADAADGAPCLVIEVGVEPRQPHGALRMLRDRVQESRRRR